MNDSIQTIPLIRLTLAFLPVVVVIAIHYRWTREHRSALYAMGRMLAQLLLIGYLLTFLFATDSGWVVLSFVLIMVLVSSSIAIRTLRNRPRFFYLKAIVSIVVGGGSILALVTQGVLDLTPWFLPSYFIPLAGMIFANAMNSVSLAAERLEAEIGRCSAYEEARHIAFKSSLIPITNSLLAVGLVSIPGMMTGQILAGVSPLIAARYQIMVMCMVYASAGIASACFLTLTRPDYLVDEQCRPAQD